MLGPRRDDPNIPCLVHLDLHGQLGEVLEAMMQNHEYYEFLDRPMGQFFFMLPNGFDRQLGCLMVCLHPSFMEVIGGFRGGSMVHRCFSGWSYGFSSFMDLLEFPLQSQKDSRPCQIQEMTIGELSIGVVPESSTKSM